MRKIDISIKLHPQEAMHVVKSVGVKLEGGRLRNMQETPQCQGKQNSNGSVVLLNVVRETAFLLQRIKHLRNCGTYSCVSSKAVISCKVSHRILQYSDGKTDLK